MGGSVRGWVGWVDVWVCVCARARASVCVCVCARVYVCVYVCVGVHACTCMDTECDQINVLVEDAESRQWIVFKQSKYTIPGETLAVFSYYTLLLYYVTSLLRDYLTTLLTHTGVVSTGMRC